MRAGPCEPAAPGSGPEHALDERLRFRRDVARLRARRLRHRRLRPSHRRLARQPDRPCRVRSRALEQAVRQRRPGAGLVHPSDRGLRYLSIRCTGRLAEAGTEPSAASVGDSCDTALAETVNGLFKAEVIDRRGPWRSFEAVEFAALERADRFNNRRLPEPIGHMPPAEAEARFHAALETRDVAAWPTNISLRQTRCGSVRCLRTPGFRLCGRWSGGSTWRGGSRPASTDRAIRRASCMAWRTFRGSGC